MSRKAAAKPVETQEAQIEVGSFVRFLGYDDQTPESDRVLTEGESYEVKEVNEDDNGDITYAVEAANPDFDSKKRASKTNVEFVLVDVFPEEVELSDDGEDAPAEEEQAEEAPAPAAKGKTAAKGKAAAKQEEAPAPAAKGKTTAKGKADAKAAPATKGKTAAAPAKGKGKPAPAPAQDQDADELPTLENEDAEIIALVDGADDLIELAQELAGDVAATEYRLGGVLYHVKKEGEYKTLEDSRYAEKGGFELFLLEKMNIEYRKAMYLIDIYIGFNQAGIENPGEVVAQIGWTKASKIAKLMTSENADDLIELAESNTVADLQTTIKEQYAGGSGDSATPRHKRLTMKFRFLEDDGKDAMAILNEAKEIAGVKDDSDALLFILREWQLNAGGGENAEVSKEAAPNVKGKGAAKAGTGRRATAKA